MTSTGAQTHQSAFLSDRDWKAILGGIRNQQCVIFIGSEVFSPQAEKLSQSQRLADWLRQQQHELRIRVYDTGWFHLRDGSADGAACEAVREFYRQEANHAVRAMLEKIARIQFHLFVSMTPDDHLRTAFERQRLPHRPGAYVRKEPDRSNEAPTADLPVVYNMLGDLNNRNSLVLTHDDFYDYLESVFTGKSMSTLLKDNILDAQYFLFLGMPFEQWYLNLFMRILRQHHLQREKTKLAANSQRLPDDEESCMEQYNIRLVNSDIPDFIDELFARCQAAGLVKEPPPVVGNSASDSDALSAFIADLEEWLMDNDFERILNKLREVLRGVGGAGKELMFSVISLSGQYKSIRESNLAGILKFEDRMHAENKLRVDFLQLLELLRETWKTLNIRI